MIQDGAWVSCVRPGDAAAMSNSAIKPASVTRAMPRCKVVLRGVTRSIFGQSHVGGQLPVPVDVKRDELGKFYRGAAADIVVQRRYLLAYFGVAQGIIGELVPARNHRVRRSRRGRQAAPSQHLEAGIAELRHGRYLREPSRALEAGDRQRPQPAAGEV